MLEILLVLLGLLALTNLAEVWLITRLLTSRREVQPALEALSQRMDQTTVTTTTAALLLRVNAEDNRASLARLGAILTRLEDRAIGVAQDLADSHTRADGAEGPHGAAADAAARLS